MYLGFRVRVLGVIGLNLGKMMIELTSKESKVGGLAPWNIR